MANPDPETVLPIHPKTDLPCTPDTGSKADANEADPRGPRVHSTEAAPDPVRLGDPGVAVVTQDAPLPGQAAPVGPHTIETPTTRTTEY